jgi:flagellar protein FlbD
LGNIKIYLNPHIIESIENTPDTLITLTNGKKIIVLEESERVKDLFIRYQLKLHSQDSDKGW